MMDGKEGPVKVLEEKAHTERVDSILWSNLPELRFEFYDHVLSVRHYACLFKFLSRKLIPKGLKVFYGQICPN